MTTWANDTIGLFDPDASRFTLKTTPAAVPADITVTYGSASTDWLPVVGDWDGDGVDTVGLYDPVSSRFHLRNSSSTVTSIAANLTVAYGPSNGGWLPVVGDWDGDGVDTVGLYDPVSSRFSLSGSGGNVATEVSYGPPNAGRLPVAGQFTPIGATSKNGVIVDNVDPGFTTEGSAWLTSTRGSDSHGDDYLFAPGAAGPDSATWRFTINVQGEYAIFARWPTLANGSPAARYSIVNNGITVAVVERDQNLEAGQFNSLGRFTLAPGSLAIVLTRASAGEVAADAVFVGDGEFMELIAPRDLTLETASAVALEAVAINYPAEWGVEFVVKDRASAAVVQTLVDYELPYKQLLTGLPLAEYIAEIHLVDQRGVRQPVSSRARFGVGDYYVALGDSITAGSGDKDDSDNVSQDGRNRSEGYPPILNDRLTVTLGYPHSVVNEGKSGATSSGGVRVIDAVLAKHPRANYMLIQYGTNDSRNLMVPSGEGLRPDDGGYTGSFKAHMQQIIDAVTAAGKTPLLAKVPIAFGVASNSGAFGDPDSAEQNLRIQGYNRVIDELVNANGLQITPPDFYNHFRLHPEQMDDNLHPNEAGYRAMAELWTNALTEIP